VCVICSESHFTVGHHCEVAMCGAIGQVCPHAMMNYLRCGGNHTANDTRCRAKLNAIAVARGTRAKGSQLRPVHRKEQEVPMTTSGKKF